MLKLLHFRLFHTLNTSIKIFSLFHWFSFIFTKKMWHKVELKSENLLTLLSSFYLLPRSMSHFVFIYSTIWNILPINFHQIRKNRHKNENNPQISDRLNNLKAKCALTLRNEVFLHSQMNTKVTHCYSFVHSFFCEKLKKLLFNKAFILWFR